jgi:hypothetical protein
MSPTKQPQKPGCEPTQNPPVSQNLEPWKPGQSGNPGGRPKGLAKQVRELIGVDGLPLAEAMYDIAKDESEATRDRITAMQWLAERGWGKADQHIEVTGDDSRDRQIAEAIDRFTGAVVQLASGGRADIAATAANEGTDSPLGLPMGGVVGETEPA